VEPGNVEQRFQLLGAHEVAAIGYSSLGSVTSSCSPFFNTSLLQVCPQTSPTTRSSISMVAATAVPSNSRRKMFHQIKRQSAIALSAI
jgi:hypothetical protein